MRAAALRLSATLALCAACACSSAWGDKAASMKLITAKGTPRDASVYIDEEFIGPLSYVASRGVRLPEGEHRITVQKVGYFPWDQLVQSKSEPIKLQVELTPIPE